MNTTPSWSLWDGQDYAPRKLNPSIYYYPGKVDVEEPEVLDALVTEAHLDGVAPSKSEARKLLETAIVTHGRVINLDGELRVHTGDDEAWRLVVTDATWVELDEHAE